MSNTKRAIKNHRQLVRKTTVVSDLIIKPHVINDCNSVLNRLFFCFIFQDTKVCLKVSYFYF